MNLLIKSVWDVKQQIGWKSRINIIDKKKVAVSVTVYLEMDIYFWTSDISEEITRPTYQEPVKARRLEYAYIKQNTPWIIKHAISSFLSVAYEQVGQNMI